MPRKRKKKPPGGDKPLEDILLIQNPWIKGCVFALWLLTSAWLALDDFTPRKLGDKEEEDG